MGTINPTDNPCPAGTYSGSYYATTPYDCLPCPRGYGCVAHSTPQSIVAALCQAGYYCPRGSKTITEVPCPAGTYRSTTKGKKIEDCYPCPNGKFCVSASISTATCPAGYYCPLGTKSANQYPCRAGTFSSSTGLESQDGCSQCGLGNYCPGAGTAVVPCQTGYYNNVTMEAPLCYKCPAGYYCQGTGVINPVACAIGFYSDEGASACTNCEIGYYCPEVGISKANKLALYVCPAGMYCNDLATHGLSIYPNLDDHGCIVGNYCPAGTIAPVPCPSGTYNPVRGRGSVSDCLTTVQGYYTISGASSYISTPCSPGYFCLAGSNTPTQFACPAGTYRHLSQGASPTECVPCPSGYYCLTATSNPINCPMGFYCPIGTSKPESCPEGTYSNILNLYDSKACLACPAGKYCYVRNLTNPTNLCDAGFYCMQGSRRPEPKDSITGNSCPIGGYCPQGCSAPQNCPAGYLMLISGAKAQSQCTLCPLGYYCAGSNSPLPTGLCAPGYFCSLGTTTANPAAGISPIGSYAPVGSAYSLKCPRGTYGNTQGIDSCYECDPGYTCTDVGMSVKISCPSGFYCQSLTTFNSLGQSYDKLPCPIGKYNALTGRASANDCLLCPGGQYCDVLGMSASTGPCDAGFFCKTGSPYKRPPTTEASGMYGPCPVGNYCPQGSTVPTPCPIGTYSSIILLH